MLEEHDQQASELRGHVLAARQLLASKTTTPAKMFPPQVFDKARPTRFIYDRLLAGVLKSSFTFTNNDVTDLLHTAVPLAYADLVVLDKGWAEQSRQALTAARNAGHEVEVFKVGQLDAFLDAFDAWEPSSRAARTA